jgi:hypothetical protein
LLLVLMGRLPIYSSLVVPLGNPVAFLPAPFA